MYITYTPDSQTANYLVSLIISHENYNALELDPKNFYAMSFNTKIL